MMTKTRTIERDANPSEFVRAVITNCDDDLMLATVEMGLALIHSGYPTTMAPADQVTHPDEHTIIASKLITNSTPAGEYVVWVRILDTPQAVPRRAGLLNVI